EDAATGTANVAQQQLKNGSRTDDLYSVGVLGPADGIADGSGLVAAGGPGENLSRLQKSFLGDSAISFDDVGRVAGEMPLYHLEDATRMLKRGIGLELDSIFCLSTAVLAV